MKWSNPKSLAVLTLAGVLLLSGCGGGNNSNNASSNSGNASSADDTSPITFSFFGADTSPNWNNMQDDVGKEITAKTGVTINAEYDVGSGGGQSKIALMAASGQYPDLIYSKGELSKLVDAGAVIDLTDLIDKYAPHIKELMKDSMNRMKYSNEDQSIYQIPTNVGVDNEYFDATGGFEVQLRVLKEYVAKHPTTDGQPTIPLTLNADDWKIMITVTNPAFIATGAPDDGEYYVNPETYEAMLHYKRPEEKEYFRWLNKMYNEGLLDKDTFVQKDDQYQAKISSGRVLGLISQEWEYQNAENALKTAGKNDYTYAHFPVQVDSSTQDHEMQSVGLDGYGIAITTACKDPVRAIKFIDWLASDEGQVLRNWGIEGKQYTVDANGQRVIPQEIQDRKVNDANNFAKETGIGLYNVFGPHYGDGVKDSTGNYYTTNFPDQIVASYSQPEKDALKAYNATTWKDLFPSEKDLPVKDWGALYNMPVPTDGDYQVTFQKTQDIVRKSIPEAVLAKPGDFDKVYDNFIAQLNKAGAEKMEAEFTDLVKKRASLFTGKEIK